MGRVLVLGDTGLVGRAVAAHLRAVAEHDAITANRSGANGALVVDADSGAIPVDLLRGVDTVVNAIGVLRDDRPTPQYRLTATRVNAMFPLLLSEAAARQGCRVVHISTNAVFGRGTHPADEETPVAPDDLYGLTKTLGESDGNHVINIRCSVIGPAPGRTGLWEWLVGQPPAARVSGYTDHVWTGVTSRQLGLVCGDLTDPTAFEHVRSTGARQHFVSNEPRSKFELLSLLRDVLRPDIVVEPASAPHPPDRPMTARQGALTAIYRGARGWTAELVAAAPGP